MKKARTLVIRNLLIAGAILVPTLSLAAPVFEETALFTSGTGGYHTFRIPAAAVLPGGTILAFAEGRKASSADDGDIDLVMRRSTNGGGTWSEIIVVHEEGGNAPITIGNPTPVVDRRTGAVHLLFSRNNQRLFVMSSFDEGTTFSPPHELTSVAEGVNFDWTRLGPGPTAGIQTGAGRLVAPVWLNAKIGDPDAYRAAALFSDDGGQSWAIGDVVPLGPGIRGINESAIVELADGTLYLTGRTNAGPPYRCESTSPDGGTWSRSAFDGSINANMSAVKTSIVRYFSEATDEANRLLYSAPNTGTRSGMTVWLSEDEAETWPVSRTVHAGPSAYSELAVASDDSILLFYEKGDGSPYEKISLARFNLEWLTQARNPAENRILNPIFDDTESWGPAGSTDWPPGWTGSSPRKNAASPLFGSGAIGGGGTSAHLPAFATSVADQRREIKHYMSDTAANWEFSFDLAGGDPGSGDARSMSLGINHGSGQITLRITDRDDDGRGEIEYYANEAWTPIGALDGAIVFSSEPTVQPSVNRIRVTGRYAAENPAFDVAVEDAEGGFFEVKGLRGWQTAAPAPGAVINLVSFNTFLSSADYVIDNLLFHDADLLPGDADGNGRINGADLDVVRANWGGVTIRGDFAAGDFSGDGAVGSADLDVIRANWGNKAAAVPEPRAVLLIGAGLLTVARASRRPDRVGITTRYKTEPFLRLEIRESDFAPRVELRSPSPGNAG